MRRVRPRAGAGACGRSAGCKSEIRAERLRRCEADTVAGGEHKIGDGPVEREVKAISERDRAPGAVFVDERCVRVRALDQAEDGAQRDVIGPACHRRRATTSAELRRVGQRHSGLKPTLEGAAGRLAGLYHRGEGCRLDIGVAIDQREVDAVCGPRSLVIQVLHDGDPQGMHPQLGADEPVGLVEVVLGPI